MALLKDELLLQAATASTTGSWFPLNWRDDPGGLVRSFTGKLTSGDTVYMEVTNQRVNDAQGIAVSVSVIATVSAFTETIFSSAFTGPFVAVRFRKTGTTGPATVYGIV